MCPGSDEMEPGGRRVAVATRPSPSTGGVDPSSSGVKRRTRNLDFVFGPPSSDDVSCVVSFRDGRGPG